MVIIIEFHCSDVLLHNLAAALETAAYIVRSKADMIDLRENRRDPNMQDLFI